MVNALFSSPADDIIKLNKKQKQEQGRGGSNRSQGKSGSRGQGVEGVWKAGVRGGGSGISPLKRKKVCFIA